MLLTSRVDLETLSHRISTELARGIDKTPFELIPVIVAKPSADGWYVDIAKLPSGATFTVFLDRSTGKRLREPWYRFSTRDRAEADILAKAATAVLGHEPTRDAEARPLRNAEYGRLFLEAIGPREFYVGVYAPVRRLIYPSSRDLRRIARFARDVASALHHPRPRHVARIEGSVAGAHLTVRTQRALLGRRGQAAFRRRLVRADGPHCSISGPVPVFLLEAAHIATARAQDDHSLGNGLLLRADLHTLFDLGHIAIEPVALRAWLSPVIRNLPMYKTLHRRALSLNIQRKNGLNRQGLIARWSSLAWTPTAAS